MTAALLSLLLLSGTLAYWVSAAPATHVINTGRLDGELVEQYNPPASVEPGVDVTKIVNVKNVGEVDMIVRVKVTTAWGDSRNADGQVIPNPALSPNMIKITYNSTLWMDGGDGYFYYKGILKPGETTTQPLFESFTVDKNVGDQYKNKLADIVVSMECLQAAGGAVKTWGKTYTQLGVTEPVAPAGTKTSVTFESDKKFVFNPESTDLFASFKDLVPGETRVQTIDVTNKYSKKVEIMLRALAVDQNKATPENLALVQEMLEKYATVVITDDSGKVIYEGPVWGNYPNTSTGKDSMKDYISLGSFDVNASKTLTVKLTLDPSLDNRYQDLWGLIRWEFLAQGDEAKDTTTSLPQTGGSNNVILWFIIFATALAAVGIVVFTLRKMQTSENELCEASIVPDEVLEED